MKKKAFSFFVFVVLLCLHVSAWGNPVEPNLNIAFTNDVDGEITPHRL